MSNGLVGDTYFKYQKHEEVIPPPGLGPGPASNDIVPHVEIKPPEVPDFETKLLKSEEESTLQSATAEKHSHK